MKADRAGRSGVEEPAGEVGEFRRLGDHHAIDRQADIGQHHPHHALADAAQDLGRIAVVVGAVECLGQGLVAFLAHVGGEQGGLAVEIIVQGSFGDTGDGGDSRHARALIAVGGEHVGRAGQDLRPLFRA